MTALESLSRLPIPQDPGTLLFLAWLGLLGLATVVFCACAFLKGGGWSPRWSQSVHSHQATGRHGAPWPMDLPHRRGPGQTMRPPHERI